MIGEKRKLAKLEAKKEAERLAKKREMEAKVKIKNTLSSMKGQLSKLDTVKSNYIDKARKALESGNKHSYKMATDALKACLTKQRFLEHMLMNFEVSLEMTDMNKIIGEFVEGMNIISKEMSKITSSADFIKMQADFEKAMEGNVAQYEMLEELMSSTSSNFDSINVVGGDVTDDEISNLIANQAITEAESKFDAQINHQPEVAQSDEDLDIQKKIEAVRSKIDNLS